MDESEGERRRVRFDFPEEFWEHSRSVQFASALESWMRAAMSNLRYDHERNGTAVSASVPGTPVVIIDASGLDPRAQVEAQAFHWALLQLEGGNELPPFA